MKTLLQLVQQYKSDVEQRIICIKEEHDSNPSTGETIEEDYNAQIAHWEATLKQIDKALLGCGYGMGISVKYDEAIQIKLISVLYEWVCPECNKRNKGSGINEEVVCSGCSKPFKIKFQNTP